MNISWEEIRHAVMKRETRTEQRNPKLWGEFLKLEKSEYENG